MKLIRRIGTRLSKSGWLECYGLFVCSFCLQEVERKLSAGKVALSCGCNRNKAISKSKTNHGESKTRLYNIWNNMIQRCCNLNTENYKYYGGRGITICDEWANNYVKFRDWSLSNGYAYNLEIDRKDNDLGYSPENCQWILKIENNRKKRKQKVENMGIANEIRFKYNSGYYTQKQLAKEYNVNEPHISRIINNERWNKE